MWVKQATEGKQATEVRNMKAISELKKSSGQQEELSSLKKEKDKDRKIKRVRRKKMEMMVTSK